VQLMRKTNLQIRKKAKHGDELAPPVVCLNEGQFGPLSFPLSTGDTTKDLKAALKRSKGVNNIIKRMPPEVIIQENDPNEVVDPFRLTSADLDGLAIGMTEGTDSLEEREEDDDKEKEKKGKKRKKRARQAYFDRWEDVYHLRSDIPMEVRMHTVLNTGSKPMVEYMEGMNAWLIKLYDTDRISIAPNVALQNIKGMPESMRRGFAKHAFGDSEYTVEDLEEYLSSVVSFMFRLSIMPHECVIPEDQLHNYITTLGWEYPLCSSTAEDFVYDYRRSFTNKLYHKNQSMAITAEMTKHITSFQRAILATFSGVASRGLSTALFYGVPLSAFQLCFWGKLTRRINDVIYSVCDKTSLHIDIAFPETHMSLLQRNKQYKPPDYTKEDTDTIFQLSAAMLNNGYSEDVRKDVTRLLMTPVSVMGKGSFYTGKMESLEHTCNIKKRHLSRSSSSSFSQEPDEKTDEHLQEESDEDSDELDCEACHAEWFARDRIVPIWMLPVFLSHLPEPFLSLNPNPSKYLIQAQHALNQRVRDNVCKRDLSIRHNSRNTMPFDLHTESLYTTSKLLLMGLDYQATVSARALSALKDEFEEYKVDRVRSDFMMGQTYDLLKEENRRLRRNLSQQTQQMKKMVKELMGHIYRIDGNVNNMHVHLSDKRKRLPPLIDIMT